MAEVSLLTFIFFAFATGFGSGVGTPFGNFLFKKYWEPRLEKLHEKVQNLKPGDVIKVTEISIDTQAKIDQMLGKK